LLSAESMLAAYGSIFWQIRADVVLIGCYTQYRLKPGVFDSHVWEKATTVPRRDGSSSFPGHAGDVEKSCFHAVAAVALTQEGHGRQTYTITGGEVLTPRKMTGMTGAALGRTIVLKELDEAEAIAVWRAAGMAEEIIEFMRWAYGNTPPAGYTVVPTVQQVTGRPPRTFRQWVSEAIEQFR
jgi:hypothetical protein